MYIIKDVSEFKNPFLCYCAITRWINEAEEDFLNYNETIVSGWPFVMWMYGKKYINEEQVEMFATMGMPTVQEVLQSEVLFPKTGGYSKLSNIKIYVILAEYLSSLSEFRQKLWDVCSNKSTGFIGNQFYKDKDGISLAFKIEDKDLQQGTIRDLQYMRGISEFDIRVLPMWEQYYSFKQFDINSCDFEDDNIMDEYETMS